MAGRPKAFDRDEALEQAMALFWRRGYTATSMGELCEAMGIKRQSLYDTFGDKHALFLAAIDRYCTMMADEMLAGLATPGAGLPALRATVGGVIDFLLQYPDRRACLMVNTALEMAPHDRVVADKVKVYMAAMESAFVHALDNALRQGALAQPADIPALARYLVGLVNGLVVAAKSGAGRPALDDIARIGFTALPVIDKGGAS